MADQEGDQQRVGQRHGVHAVEARHARRVQLPRPVGHPELVRVSSQILSGPRGLGPHFYVVQVMKCIGRLRRLSHRVIPDIKLLGELN